MDKSGGVRTDSPMIPRALQQNEGRGFRAVTGNPLQSHDSRLTPVKPKGPGEDQRLGGAALLTRDSHSPRPGSRRNPFGAAHTGRMTLNNPRSWEDNPGRVFPLRPRHAEGTVATGTLLDGSRWR
jgi:hypothetical protein